MNFWLDMPNIIARLDNLENSEEESYERLVHHLDQYINQKIDPELAKLHLQDLTTIETANKVLLGMHNKLAAFEARLASLEAKP